MKCSSLCSCVVAALFLAGQGSAMADPGDLLYTFRSANPQAGENFGFSLDVAGDTIIIGAPAAYTNTIPGAVYVFDKTTRAHRATLGQAQATPGAIFGHSVAGVGNDVVVGAYRAPGGGAVYVYDGSNAYSLKCPAIQNPNEGDPDAGFGGCVKAIGDKFLVGAVHDDAGGVAPECGAVYLFDKAGTLLHTFRPPSIGTWKNFSKFLAPMGTNKVLIGAPLEGGAYFFEDDGTGWNLKCSIPAASGPYYGFSGATLGSRGIVTSWSATHVYDLSGATDPPQLLATIPVGGFVAVVGDDILIAPHGGNVAYLYDGATYQQLLQISPPGAGISPAVGGVGNDILTGDALIGPNGVNDQTGAVYLFQGAYSNQDPDANAGPDQTVNCGPQPTVTVTLDGSASSDPDGDTLEFVWTVPAGSPVTLANANNAVTTATIPATQSGDYPILLTVTDGKGGTDTDEVVIKVVVDSTPPDITCWTDKVSLWPPNHQIVEVTLLISASDGDVTAACTSSEPDDANGDGEFTGDVNGGDGFIAPQRIALSYDAAQGCYVGTLRLRAERDGSETGRTYSILCTATDAYGNSATARCAVVVPHDRRRN